MSPVKAKPDFVWDSGSIFEELNAVLPRDRRNLNPDFAKYVVEHGIWWYGNRDRTNGKKVYGETYAYDEPRGRIVRTDHYSGGVSGEFTPEGRRIQPPNPPVELPRPRDIKK